MILKQMLHTLRGLLVLLCLVVPLTPASAWGEDDDESLELFSAGEDHTVATARFPRPTSKIAENVTVITAADIERLNAHTLAEVLETVPGIHLDQLQTPGNNVFFYIQGAISRHVLVQIDGVPQNFLSSDNKAELGSIPVQMIDRVEIIKGAASAAWGSALGGVINITTKSPNSDRQGGGEWLTSIGSRSTFDNRAEVSGSVDRFGYYLTAGDLRSDGLTPGTQTRLNHGFAKFTYRLPEKGSLTAGFDLRDLSTGLEDFVPYDFHDTSVSRYSSGYLDLRYPLADRLAVSLKGYSGRRTTETKWGALTVPDLFMDGSNREIYQGANLGLVWGDAEDGLAAGLDYERQDIRGREAVSLAPENNFDLGLDRWSSYLNGIWTLGRFSLLPGFRFDHTNQLDDAYSFTLGATYQLTDTTTLRAYAARGYGMPVINKLALMNGQRGNQDIQTVQVGVETAAIPYLWLKGTLFYNNIWNIQSFDTSVSPSVVTFHDQVRQGGELELRTTPWHGVSLTGGYTYTDSWDKDTKAELTSNESGPRQLVKLGTNYDNKELGLRGALTGNYVWWNVPADQNGNVSGTIWDLHLNWKMQPKNELSPELFFSARNIFNGNQYITDFKPNAPRWFEGGLRVRF